MSTTIILWYMKFTRMIFPPVMLVRVDLVEHALGFLVVLRGARFHVSPSVDGVGIGRGAAYEIAAGVLELVRELLHALVELFHILFMSVGVVGHTA